MIKQTTKSPTGTSFHGNTVTTTLDKLTKAFGEPGMGDMHKVMHHWCLELPTGEVITIYDWKEFRRIESDTVVEWHIGGRTEEATTKAEKQILDILEKN